MVREFSGSHNWPDDREHSGRKKRDSWRMIRPDDGDRRVMVRRPDKSPSYGSALPPIRTTGMVGEWSGRTTRIFGIWSGGWTNTRRPKQTDPPAVFCPVSLFIFDSCLRGETIYQITTIRTANKQTYLWN